MSISSDICFDKKKQISVGILALFRFSMTLYDTMYS